MYVCIYVYASRRGRVDGGRTPLTTHPQQYCDPASLDRNVDDKNDNDTHLL